MLGKKWERKKDKKRDTMLAIFSDAKIDFKRKEKCPLSSGS